MTAGPALKKENVAGYNCSYIKVDSPRSFDEILYVLMNGTGVGFSVEQEYTDQLPPVPEELYDTVAVVEDVASTVTVAAPHVAASIQLPSQSKPAAAPSKSSKSSSFIFFP